MHHKQSTGEKTSLITRKVSDKNITLSHALYRKNKLQLEPWKDEERRERRAEDFTQNPETKGEGLGK